MIYKKSQENMAAVRNQAADVTGRTDLRCEDVRAEVDYRDAYKKENINKVIHLMIRH